MSRVAQAQAEEQATELFAAACDDLHDAADEFSSTFEGDRDGDAAEQSLYRAAYRFAAAGQLLAAHTTRKTKARRARRNGSSRRGA